MTVTELMGTEVVGVNDTQYGLVSDWFGGKFISDFYGSTMAYLEGEFDKPTAEGLARVFVEIYCSGYADGHRVSRGADGDGS